MFNLTLKKAILSAIECLETITSKDGVSRYPGFQDWVDLNEPGYGRVDAVLDELRAALAEVDISRREHV